MTFYAIRQKATGWFLPLISSRGGRGFTWVEPTSAAPPRLFTTLRAARNALTWWLQGPAYRVASRHVDWEGIPDDSEDIASQMVPGRDPSDFEIVPIELTVKDQNNAAAA